MTKRRRYKRRKPKVVGPKPSDVAADRRSIIDQDGRRIGHMFPEDFEAHLVVTFGELWIQKFSRYAGLSRDTVDLYRKGALPIPKYIAQLVMLMRYAELTTIYNRPIPTIDTFWLPDPEIQPRGETPKLGE